MEMSEADIVLEYRQSRDKKGQIQILADLNECQVKDIVRILEDHGEHPESAVKRRRGRPPKQAAEPKHPLVDSSVVAEKPYIMYKDGDFATPDEEPTLPDDELPFVTVPQKRDLPSRSLPIEVADLVTAEMDRLDALLTQKQREIEEIESRYANLARFIKGE